MLNGETGQHFPCDARDPLASHALARPLAALDRLQQVVQAAVARHRYPEPLVDVEPDLAALVQAEHPRLHIPVVAGELLTGLQQHRSLSHLAGDRRPGILEILGGYAAHEDRPGWPQVHRSLVAGQITQVDGCLEHRKRRLSRETGASLNNPGTPGLPPCGPTPTCVGSNDRRRAAPQAGHKPLPRARGTPPLARGQLHSPLTAEPHQDPPRAASAVDHPRCQASAASRNRDSTPRPRTIQRSAAWPGAGLSAQAAGVVSP